MAVANITSGNIYKTTFTASIPSLTNFTILFEGTNGRSLYLVSNNIYGLKYQDGKLFYIDNDGNEITGVSISTETIYYYVSLVVGEIPAYILGITDDFNSGTFTVTETVTGISSTLPTYYSVDEAITTEYLTLESGYTWINSIVKVFMDGVEITNEVYNPEDHTLFEDEDKNAWGNIVLYASALSSSTTYTIEHSEGEHTTFTGNVTATIGSTYTATITTTSSYYMDSINVYMGENDITEEVVTINTNRNSINISISVVTDNIRIVTTEKHIPTVTYHLTGCTTEFTPTTEVLYGEPYISTFITSTSSYTWVNATASVIMGLVDITSTSWNLTNHKITITSVTDNLDITIKATELKTYTVKNNSGETTYETDTTPYPITSIKLTLSGNTRNLNLGSIILAYTQVIPAGKKLIGLTLTANSDRLFIGVGFEGSVYLNEDTTFYEVLVDESEIPTGCTLNLYQNKSDSNEVNKDLTLIGTLEGTLREPTDIINPVITISYATLPNFNYIYVPQLKRYYFINDIVSVRTGLWAISLKVDVLTSYKDLIYSQVGFISRQENEYNNDLVDDERVVTRQPEVVIQDMVLSNTGKFSQYNNKTVETEIDADILVTVVRKDR